MSVIPLWSAEVLTAEVTALHIHEIIVIIVRRIARGLLLIWIRGEARVFRVGVTGKAASSQALRADGQGPKGRHRGGVLGGPHQPGGLGERCELPQGFGAELRPPSGFSIFWVLWVASPVNRIQYVRCRDVFSSSFIYFAHYRVRLTVIIPPLELSGWALCCKLCSAVWWRMPSRNAGVYPLLKEEISHRISANPTIESSLRRVGGWTLRTLQNPLVASRLIWTRHCPVACGTARPGANNTVSAFTSREAPGTAWTGRSSDRSMCGQCGQFQGLGVPVIGQRAGVMSLYWSTLMSRLTTTCY